MCINLHLPLFTFAYLFFFLFFLFFPLNIFISFIFIALFSNWHLALILFSSLCFNLFCSGRHNFWFPLFTESIYCTQFLLDCFDFAYGCICICVYSVTLSIVINLCLYIELLSSVEFSFFPLFSFFFHFFLFYNFNFLKSIIFFLHSFLHLPFILFFTPCSWSLVYINLLHLPLFNLTYLFFLSFLSSQHIC